MANPYKNKVVYGGTTLIDLTDATATADKILTGYTAYGATGEKLTGTASGGSGGYVVRVTAETGSTVTMTKDGTTYTAEESSGTWDFTVPDEGNYEVTGTKGAITESVTVYVPMGPTIIYIDPILENNTWADISAVSIAGTGDTYWDVGDMKSVVLNGTVGTLALSNYMTYVFILDFNHPVNKTTADNNIIWGGFKTFNGVDIALCDSIYNGTSSDGTRYFTMNHWGSSAAPPYNTNYGGWKGCDLRYDILGGTSTKPSVYGKTKTTAVVGYDATTETTSSPVSNTLMAALPSDLRNVLRLWTRYIDSKGNTSNTEGNVTATVDALSLLAEFEIYGARNYANIYEQGHQKQMAYYAAGNSKIKYMHSATTTAALWWAASPVVSDSGSFCRVATDGIVNSRTSRISTGLSPAFKT